MKKFFVSSVVVVTFIAYSTYQHMLGAPTTLMAPELSQTIQTSIPATGSTPMPAPTPSSGYKDGNYTGDPADAFYGIIQVRATIANGRITNIQFLQAPSDRQTSVIINRQADPMLAQEAVQAQNANVDIVSGATASSNAFIQSLRSALNKARG